MNMKTIQPPRLKRGETIGVFSPSAPATAWIAERTALAVRFLADRGFRVRLGTLAGHEDAYRSGSIQARAEELNALIGDPEVRCLMAAAGGMVSNSILPYIDYDAIRRDPKIFVGYSDVTAVLSAVYAKTGLTTFYGPCLIPTFGEALPFSEQAFGYFLDVVGEKVEEPHAFPTPRYWTSDSVGLEESGVECGTHENRLVTVRGGVAEGRLLGGNLDTLPGFFGTPYMPEIREGDILLLEDSRKTAECEERSFSLLENAGVFRKIGGLILGKHADFRDGGSGLPPWEAPLEIIGKYRFPVLAEFDCAHTKPMLTMPIGGRIRLDADARAVKLLERAVR